MIRQYFKIALRSLGRQKGLTFINISGLSIGLACFILFMLYAVNEFNYDRFHRNAASIFRVYRLSEGLNGQEAEADVYMPNPLGPAMKADLPDVLDYVRIQDGWRTSYVQVGDKVLQGRLSFTDPSFFTVFSFLFTYGNPAKALVNLNDVVITRSKAQELFGSENAIGRSINIKINDKFEPFTVTGVAADIPANSTLRFEMMGHWKFMESSQNGKRNINNWNRSSYLTYVLLKNGSSLPDDMQRLAAFRKKYYPIEAFELRKSGFKWEGNKSPVRYGLQPFRASHTDTRIPGGPVEPADPKTIWILLSIAGGVLLIACINFTTLAIGRSADRAREVGMRKVIGAVRRQLVSQFLAEAILLTFISAALGLALAALLLPWFNELSGRSLDLSFRQYPEMLWLSGALILSVGLLAGSYPAFVLSRFNPIETIKRKIRLGGSNLFTKSLVSVQFALSIGLIISTVVILNQTDYISGRNPGFSKENVVLIDAEETNAREIYPLFRQLLTTDHSISGIASSEIGLGEGTGWSRTGFEYNDSHKEVFEYFIDENYINVMGMQLIAGRNFNPVISFDSINSIIVNEAMVRDFGWTLQNAVGQELNGYMETKTPVVIGVVKDFNFRPLKEEIKPQMFHCFSDYSPHQFFVRIKPGNPKTALTALRKAWQAVEPLIPFQYSFLDESLDNFYKAERRWSAIAGWAGGISIFLACLGLFGLASLAAVNRTREIGIRKVLGAWITDITTMLSRDFVGMIVVAFLIASPLVWWSMHRWLQDFAYRTEIKWWFFAAGGFGALFIAVLTVSIEAIKASLANPVNALRTE
jgi:putative ABC transport system permease protein